MEILLLLTGGLLFGAGFSTCYYFCRNEGKAGEAVIQKLRIKPSMKSPMRPYVKEYENYKAKNGLFQPSEPKRGD